jgi:hypothetical protein
VIAQSKQPERKLSQRERLELEIRRLITAGVPMEQVSQQLEVGFVFIRKSCLDLPGAAMRDQVGSWLPDDDEANTSRHGIGYWVPSPEYVNAVLRMFKSGELRICNVEDRKNHESQ